MRAKTRKNRSVFSYLRKKYYLCLAMKLRRLIISLMVIVMMVAGCGKAKEINLTSCSVESVSLNGLRSVDASLLLGVDNPSVQFTLEDIEGILYYKGKAYINYTADTLKVEAKSNKVYPLDCTATLAEGVYIPDLLKAVNEYELKDLTTDIKAKVKLRGGISKELTFRDLPIDDIMGEK